MNRPILYVFISALACACAPPMAGHSCAPNEKPVCGDATSALVCKDSFWVSKSCAYGCKTENGGVTCPDTYGVATAGTSGCTEGTYACQDSATALECRQNAWVQLPCRGTDGCRTRGEWVTCDLRGSLEGDRCASSAAGTGLCTADGLGTLECRAGTLVKTNTCRACSTNRDQIECQP